MNSKWLLFLIIFTLMLTAIIDANAQLSGKTYEGRVKYVCKKMVDGGCAITTYCVLHFSEQTVEVHYYSKASCTPKEREAKYSHDYSNEKETYKWSKSGDVIIIEGFNEYGTYKFLDNKLVGSKRDDEETEIKFIEK